MTETFLVFYKGIFSIHNTFTSAGLRYPITKKNLKAWSFRYTISYIK